MGRVRDVMAVLSLAGFMLLVVATIVSANGVLVWAANGVPISAASGDQRNPLLAADGAGGAIVGWLDGRAGVRGRIYAQRVGANGQVAWMPDGVFAISSTRQIDQFAIIGDGQGGAFIVWEDYARGEGWPIGDLLAQHLTASGLRVWATTGLTVSATWNDEEIGGLIGDGVGGGILAWNEYAGPSEIANVYVQRFNADGVGQWGQSGVRLTPIAGYQEPNARLATDQQQGAYVAFLNPDNQVVLRRVLANGNPNWSGGGITLTTGSVAAVNVETDGAGGAVVAWTAVGGGLAAQRVLSTGNPIWNATGITLTDDVNATSAPQLLADGDGGVYAAWHIWGNQTVPHIYAQHVLSTGVLAWPANGISLTLAGGQSPNLASDGHGGVLVLWRNYAEFGVGHHSCWAQRIDAGGTLQWTTVIITASTNYYSNTTCSLVGDLNLGAIAAWRDWRTGADGDIYAQRILDFTPTNWLYLPLIRK